MKRVLMGILVFVVAFLGVWGFDLAPDQEAEELDFSWGTVSSISKDRMVLVEIDLETDEEIDVSYLIDAHTEFQNVDSIDDIGTDDSVDLDYVFENGKRVAKVIYVNGAEEEQQVEYDESVY